MAYRHAPGYERLESCEIVACADIVREHAEQFAAEYGLDSDGVYEDAGELIREAAPDIVSVCTPPATHADLAVEAARADSVRAVHCEKPMADTWAKSRRMARVCEAEGVQLTVNHQLRFGRPYRKAKALVRDGAVGELRRLEFAAEHLYDTGTHAFDLCNYFAGEHPVEWVLGQIEYSESNVLFGVHNENQGLVQWRYGNGVYGIGSTGWGKDFSGCRLRLRGTDGEIEIDESETPLRVRIDGEGWHPVDTGSDGVYGPDPGLLRTGSRRIAETISPRLADRLEIPTYTQRAIADIVEALREGGESELAADRALAADELIYAAWESARQRGRVDLPLHIEDNPLEAMVAGDELGVAPHR